MPANYYTRSERSDVRKKPEPKLRVSEADVQQAVVLMLELDGWRFFRTEMTVQREFGRAVGESGMPDALFLRYWQPDHLHNDTRPIGEMLWIEMKAPGKPLKTHQRDWADAERKRGALVLKVDSIDDFKSWYRNSGLNRNML